MNTKDLVADGLVNIPEACRFLGIGKSKLYELMETGDIPYVLIGAARRIPKRALVDFAADRVVERRHSKATIAPRDETLTYTPKNGLLALISPREVRRVTWCDSAAQRSSTGEQRERCGKERVAHAR